MNNENQEFVLYRLKKLEANRKFREITWLSESYFCGEKIKGMLKDENGNSRTVLIPVHCEMNKDEMRKDGQGYDRYYADPVELNGTEYLVYNHWTKELLRGFSDWLDDVISK
ncbi:MAG: hypothetical protein HDR52_04745 [Treponema sp.]|nr:hypothetical protein [Treponema sp.]